MRDRIYLVDWKRCQITRAVRLGAVLDPLLNAGMKASLVRVVCWHDRKCGFIRFSVGRSYAELDSPGQYESCLEAADVRFFYSGNFEVGQLTQPVPLGTSMSMGDGRLMSFEVEWTKGVELDQEEEKLVSGSGRRY